MSQSTRSGPRDQLVFAAVLILVGVGALVMQVAEQEQVAGGGVVALIGIGLLGAFAYTRAYGYLIPGSIMTGLGIAIAVAEVVKATDEGEGGVIVLGLGLGFIGIWVISSIAQLSEHHWWPLIPGGILTAIGGALLIGGQAVQLLDYWGVILVAIGLVVLWQAMRTRRPG
jgi:hypothetical protein